MEKVLSIKGKLVGSVRLCKGDGYTEIDTYQLNDDFYNVIHVEDREGYFVIEVFKGDVPTVSRESVLLIENEIRRNNEKGKEKN